MGWLNCHLILLFFFWSCFPSKPKVSESLVCLEQSYPTRNLSFLGHAPRSHCKARHVKKLGDQVVFDTIYDFDEWGMRPVLANPNAGYHLILYGGSNAFGEGLSENEHLSQLLSEALMKYQVADLSYRGYGPYQAASLLKRNPLKGLHGKAEGVFIYLFFHHHLKRFFLDPAYLSWSQGNAPYWEETEVGVFEDRGLIKNFLSQDTFPKKSKYRKVRYSDVQLKKFARYLQFLYQQYKSRFPQGRFILYVAPFYRGAWGDNIERIEKFLSRDIEVWRDREYREKESDFILNDGHLSIEGVKQLKSSITKRLLN